MQSSSSSSSSSLSRPPNDQPRSAVPPMYWCHECRIEMRPLMTPNPTCPRCNEGFVEEIDSASNATGMDDEDDDDVDSPQNFDQRPFMGAAQQFGSPEPPAIGSGLDLGSLMGGILRGLATAGSQPRTPAYEAPSSVDDHRGRPSIGNNAGNNGTYRSGTSQIGPITYSWGVGNYQHNSNTANGSSSNNAGGASGPSPLSLHDFVHRSQVDQHHRHHDDGMGGAGAAADGRFFNAGNENRNQAHDHPLSDNERDGDRYPPELASIRDVFANLFGAMGDGPANMLVDLFGGGSGRTGDYVWGQQGLDDVITQLMEQTRGSTAPPPATEEAIEGLPRFSRKDVAKVREARNRECSTCMDSFEEDGEGVPSALEPSLDSNRLTSTLPGASPYDMGADDPPETLPQDEQPDEVVMMPCKHLFHLDCLLPWLRTNRTCPVCRVSLESEKDKEGAKGNASGHSGNGYGLPSQGATTATADDVFTDDENEESVEAIRERSRRAAEARFAGSGGAGTSAQHQQRLPGSFLPPDDLD